MQRLSYWSPVLAATLLSAAAEVQPLRVALAKQPFSPTGTSVGPNTMADGGIQELLAKMGATVRIDESSLTAAQDTEYGTWKRLGWALGDYAQIVAKNERDGYFTVGLSQVDRLYIHIDMDVVDPREVSMHVNKVPGGPSSEEMATLLRRIFERHPKAAAVGFATGDRG